jgi:Tol biopolymer transport system component
VAEFDWSHDGSRLAYHTPGPGDPLFVSNGSLPSGIRPIFAAHAGLHSHFPSWSPDSAYIYFVQGALPDKLDIWRIPPTGGTAERITSHNARVSYPVLLDRRTLMYLASDSDGAGPWLYGMDVERRVPHPLTTGFERYTSLAASADGRRLVVTTANPRTTLWRLRLGDSSTEVSVADPIPLTTGTGFSPRLGSDYLVYFSDTGSSQAVWKVANGTSTQLWSGQGLA